ncbi:Aste57867_19459 [Aphanomyces stellatus]|uniref:Aste57867_19459 protein n=1 Tax=Aphanomyces stellatus TaxID=120398 RepID=A0A485LCV7_9STRA|nr:hypothetical protein As57867_019395 [Aphanomyces stellatus]VFT96171.1 Aste57867_19459 [Aphanomyces stellatus]
MDDSKLYPPYTFGVGANITALHINCDRTFVLEAPDTTETRIEGITDLPIAKWDGLGYSESVVNGETTLVMSCIAASSVRRYLVNVYVPTRSIRTITFVSSGTLVVYPQTLVTSPSESIAIENTNSGTIFVQDSAISVGRLRVHAAGSGSIQWDVPTTVVATAADLTSSDASSVALFASTAFQVHEMKVSSIGTGDVAVSSSNLTITTHLQTEIAGSGNVVFSCNGTCGDQSIRQMGPGNAYTSAITCANTSVLAASAGDVYVATTNALDVDQMGSGTVYLELSPERDQVPTLSGILRLVHRAPTIPAISHVQAPPHVLLRPSSRENKPSDDDMTNEVKQYHVTLDGTFTALDLDCGRTFVVEDPAQNEAIIRYEIITDSSSYLWQAYGHTEGVVGGDKTLGLVCKPVNSSKPHYVNIYVATRSILKITSRADGDVVVYPQTLVSSNSTALSISNGGMGNIFIQDSHAVVTQTLSLHVDAAGSIQWNVPTTVATTAIDLRASDTGSIFVFASTSLAAPSLVAAASGSGGIAVAATTMAVSALETDISELWLMLALVLGSGGVAYSTTNGSCANHAIKQMGPGNAYTSAIMCANTTVLAASSGDIYLAVMRSLDVNQMGSGTVYLEQVSPLPPFLSGRYQLLQTNPRPLVIPHVPVPPHDMDGWPETHSPRGNYFADGFAVCLVVFGLYFCFSCCCCCWRRKKPRPTTTSEGTTEYQATASQPTKETRAMQREPKQQTPLYDPYSGTISYVNTEGRTLLQPRDDAHYEFVPSNPHGATPTLNGGNVPLYTPQRSYGSNDHAGKSP